MFLKFSLNHLWRSLVDLWAAGCSPVSQLKRESTRNNFLEQLVDPIISTRKSLMDSYCSSDIDYF